MECWRREPPSVCIKHGDSPVCGVGLAFCQAVTLKLT